MSDERTTHGENSIHIENSTVQGHVVGGRDNTLNVHNYPEPVFPIHYLPPHNPNFTGREAQLAQLHTALSQREATVAITQTIAGLGGVGKTQLALAYAHQHKGEYELAWWLDGSDGLTIDLGLQTLGRRLNLPLPADDFAAMRQIVLSAVNSMAQRWLLIYDNVDSLPPHDLQPYLPSGKGSVLITSRNPRWGNMAVLSLPVFTPAESAAFWQKRLGVGSAAQERARAELAVELGHFPLALEHAAAYIHENEMGADDYVRLFRARRDELWAEAEPPDAYTRTITTTWNLAFDEARREAGAAALLNLFCFLDGEGIPLALLREHADGLPPELGAWVGDVLALNRALKALSRYSLVARQGETVSMHRLVQAVGRDQMGAERRAEWLVMTVYWLFGADDFDLHDMNTWPATGRLLPHLQAAVAEAERWEMENEPVAALNDHIDCYLSLYGQLAKAKPYSARALAIREKVWGVEHPNTAASLNNLGSLLQAMGELGEAQPYFARALAIHEKVLGVEHPTTASSLNNMGGLLDSMGELAEARTYYARALAIQEKVLGPEHPDTALSLNNMGGLLQDMGELAEARTYYARALAIYEKVLGAEHSDMATRLNSMGTLLQALGKLAEARTYYARALAISEKVLGPEHPHTASSLNNMGGLLQEMGKLAEARPYVERALAICEKVLGAEHPDLVYSLHNLAWLCHDEGDYPEAARLMRRAVAIREQKLGPNHPDTQDSREDLAAIEAKLAQS